MELSVHEYDSAPFEEPVVMAPVLQQLFKKDAPGVEFPERTYTV